MDIIGQVSVGVAAGIDDVYKGLLLRKAPSPASYPVAVKHLLTLLSPLGKTFTYP